MATTPDQPRTLVSVEAAAAHLSIPGWVVAVAWSPEGTRLASVSYDSTVRLWNPVSGDQLATLTGHTGWVFVVAGLRKALGSPPTTPC